MSELKELMRGREEKLAHVKDETYGKWHLA